MSTNNDFFKRNDYFCYIDEKKLTEAEWDKIHAEEVADGEDDMFGYWHCDTYELYCKGYDYWMAVQVENRDALRKWYVRLMKAPFDEKWVESIGDFNESFKDCYGRSPWFYENMLWAKGKTRKDVAEMWKKMDEEAC